MGKKRARKRPDPAKLGFELMQRVIAASGDTPEEPVPDLTGKDPAAVALGRKGGLKGGKARAASMTKKQRSESAKKAAKARWSKEG
jgi:hypothetical protein